MYWEVFALSKSNVLTSDFDRNMLLPNQKQNKQHVKGHLQRYSIRNVYLQSWPKYMRQTLVLV